MRRVLLVDDSVDVHLLVRAALRRSGRTDVELHTAADGAAALQDLCPQRFPDLVITDIQMPRVDGPRLVERLRAVGFTGPILLVSAAPSRLCCAADAVVDKAHLLEDLPGLLDRWLGPERGPAQEA